MVALGADMITIKDMSGLIPPARVASLIRKMKEGGVNVPIDFHTHCTPGYGLASVVSAIAAGATLSIPISGISRAVRPHPPSTGAYLLRKDGIETG